MKIFIRFFIVAQLMLTAFNDSRADVKLPSIFSDHMVLQTGVDVPVWGRAAPGEKVTVSIAGQVRETTADKGGKWRIKLDKLAGTNAMTMVVRGKNTIEIKDVLAGEVWLCAGQSNMEMGLGGARDSAREASSANFPAMRTFRVEHSSLAAPADDCIGEWIVCSPQTAGKFSAAAFFFGREIHRELGAPVGLINASWGGTLIEAWTSLEGNSSIPEFKSIAAILAQPSATGWDESAAAALYEKKLAAYRAAADKTKTAKAKLPSPPRKPVPARLNKNVPGNLFNGMIHPLIPYAIRGAIWYQGESNAFTSRAGLYGRQLAALLDDWRARWGYELPFAWVQLPEFLPLNHYGLVYWPVIREEMLKSLSIPRTGMAVGLGLGEPDNIHPREKQGIGKRLALWALADVYGQKDVTWNGPLMEGYKIKDNEIIIAFQQAKGGLVAKDDVLKGFTIAGEDRKWVKAAARIKDNTVIVSSREVDKPAAVRYAWGSNPDWSLMNGAGLPASPFRTDSWPIEAPSVKVRKDVPEAQVKELIKCDIVIDGKMDEKAWQGLKEYSLRELKAGQEPEFKTKFKMFWAAGALYIGVECADTDAENLNIATTLDGDACLWEGDAVEILLETQAHSYYQLAINPAGAVVSLDRLGGILTDGFNSLWSAGADLAARAGENGWTVEMRLPVLPPGQDLIDPLRGIKGSKPTEENPWYFNICRQRIRDEKSESSIFSPPADPKKGFHDVSKFGKLFVK